MDIEIIKKQLGIRIRELRIAKKLRQEDLADWDFSHRHYGKLERGDTNPTLETLVRLCEIFGVKLTDLFNFLSNNDNNVSEDREVVALKVNEILNNKDNNTIRKLRLFLEEFL